MSLQDLARQLAEIAVEAGFSDHDHMTRTVVAHLGSAPSELRRRFERFADHTDVTAR